MKKNTLTALKCDGLPRQYLVNVHERLLKEATKDNPANRKLKFSQAYHILGAIYRIPKKSHFQFLKLMRQMGMLEIRPYHYLVLKEAEI
ncbi:MAG: hypothetical protein HY364_01600 [Candidatus Aenigmarchaeota archaeon]|nr:hypothetical protein [Candidatus Aenigmarchaeota archaeon]